MSIWASQALDHRAYIAAQLVGDTDGMAVLDLMDGTTACILGVRTDLKLAELVYRGRAIHASPRWRGKVEARMRG